jgi:two-component system, chemotaxis family, protein-glutamate methylesterase/glutaminase
MRNRGREIRVMVVEDSAIAREMLVELLESAPGIRVAGQASNGQEAVDRVEALAPDLITMDLEMPVMGGLEAIERIMARHPVPILVVTGLSAAGTAFAAVSRGAMDLIEKPSLDGEGRHRLIRKVRQLAGADMKAYMAFRGMKPLASDPPAKARPAHVPHIPVLGRVLAIAASTGGPQALLAILSRLDAGFPAPVVIAQHIGDRFAKGFVEWLGNATPLTVKEAASGDTLACGCVHINPPEFAMRIDPRGHVNLEERDGKMLYRPSCDTLLQSVAEIYRERSIGLILSGMGDDGVKGMAAIHQAGGVTLAQDAATSVIYGMNRIAVEAGVVQQVLPLTEIPAHLARLAGEGRRAK